MSSVDEAMSNLIREVKETEIYREYRRTLEEVMKVPGLKAQVDDYRKRNFETQMSEQFDFAKMEAFYQEFKHFREQPVVDDFLAAELAFCRLIQELNIEFTDALDFQ